MKENVFFAKEGEKGITRTSAAHLCALATGVKEEAESFLNNISFINESISIVGSNSEELPTSKGTENLEKITSSLSICSDMNAFISWYAEARKAIEAEENKLKRLTLYDWAEEAKVEIPNYPEDEYKEESFNLQDAIERLSVKDREIYLHLEATSATLGKFLHKDCPMEAARENLHLYLNKPYESSGNGRDTIIHHYTPSVEEEKVENLYMQLQRLYRNTEQNLNHMKSELRKVVDFETSAISAKKRNYYSARQENLALYNAQMGELRAQFDKWLEDKRVALSKVKFAIPKALEGTMEYLNNLGAL